MIWKKRKNLFYDPLAYLISKILLAFCLLAFLAELGAFWPGGHAVVYTALVAG